MSLARRAWPVLLAAGWAVFWWPLLDGSRVLFWRDLSFFALPAKRYLTARLAAGALPQWNPFASAGMPFLADPAMQTFYPLNAVFLAAPSLHVGLTWFMLVHLLVGAIGMYALARALGAARPVAACIGALYSLCGYNVSILDNMNYVVGVGFAPVALAAWRRALDGGGWGWVAGTALAVACMVLGGDPFDGVIACAVAALLALDAGQTIPAPHPQGPAGKPLVALAVMTGLALLLAGVQVLPTLHVLGASVRATGLSWHQIEAWSFPLQRTLELVQPFLFGTDSPALGFLGPGLYPLQTVPWVDSVYVGLIPVGFAAVAVWRAPRRAWPWLLVAAGALLLAYGRNTPVYHLLTEYLPGLSTQRYPEKFVVWVTLALCTLCAIGAQTTCEEALLGRNGPRLLARLLVAVLVTGFAYVFLTRWPVHAFLGDLALHTSVYWSQRLDHHVTHLQGLLLHTAALGLVLITVACVASRRARVYLLLLAALCDLAWLHHGHTPAMPVALLRGPPPVALRLLRAAGAPPGVRIYFDERAPGSQVSFKAGALSRRVRAALGDADIYASGYLQYYAMLFSLDRLAPMSGAGIGVSYLDGRAAPLQPRADLRYEQALHMGHPGALLAAAATPYLITAIEPHDRAWDSPSLHEVRRDQDVNLRLLAVDAPRPFARVARHVASLAPGAVDFAALGAALARDPHRTFVDLPAPRVARLGGGGEVRTVKWRSPERIHVALAKVHAPALLVLAETAAQGWQARVDGVRTPIVKADGRFIAVVLPAGAHEVDLRFRTPGLYAGLAMSLVGLLACVALLAGAGRRRRRGFS